MEKINGCRRVIYRGSHVSPIKMAYTIFAIARGERTPKTGTPLRGSEENFCRNHCIYPSYTCHSDRNIPLREMLLRTIFNMLVLFRSTLGSSIGQQIKEP